MIRATLDDASTTEEVGEACALPVSESAPSAKYSMIRWFANLVVEPNV